MLHLACCRVQHVVAHVARCVIACSAARCIVVLQRAFRPKPPLQRSRCHSPLVLGEYSEDRRLVSMVSTSGHLLRKLEHGVRLIGADVEDLAAHGSRRAAGTGTAGPHCTARHGTARRATLPRCACSGSTATLRSRAPRHRCTCPGTRTHARSVCPGTRTKDCPGTRTKDCQGTRTKECARNGKYFARAQHPQSTQPGCTAARHVAHCISWPRGTLHLSATLHVASVGARAICWPRGTLHVLDKWRTYEKARVCDPSPKIVSG
jgi:hypothetical protein